MNNVERVQVTQREAGLGKVDARMCGLEGSTPLEESEHIAPAHVLHAKEAVSFSEDCGVIAHNEGVRHL